MANILMVANFTGGEQIKNRFINLADLLSKNGHDVEVITSDFQHGTKKSKDFKSPVNEFKITRIHEPGYKSNVSPYRLYSHYVWGNNVYKYVKSFNKKPDLIYSAIPSLTQAKLLGKYCNKNHIKFITDIQDLWPEAFETISHSQALNKILFYPFHKYADAAYKYSDLVIGVSDTYKERGLKGYNSGSYQTKKVINNLTIYLGNNIQIFDKTKNEVNLFKSKDEFWIGYIGTLGYSYDIKCVIDALEISKNRDNISNIKFIIMGNGPLKEDFEKYASQKGIEAIFTGRLPYEEMVSKLCRCDIVVNPIVKGGAQSITNKVGDYAFSGVPVVNTQPNQEYRELIKEYNCGINCEVGNPFQMADAILKLYKNDNLRTEMGINARRLGEERFDRNKTYPLIITEIEKILN